MIEVNELVDLAQQLDSMLDDSEGEIIFADFGQRGAEIHVSLHFFMEKFSHADIVNRYSSDYPFQLQVNVEGILFFALVHAMQLEVLRNYASDEQIAHKKAASQGIVSGSGSFIKQTFS